MSLPENKASTAVRQNAHTAAGVNRRHYRRVNVALNGALCLREKKIVLIKTTDISEGGICIAHDKPLPLAEGNKVKLQLEGVLYSGPQRGMDIFCMKVIHTSTEFTGLQFAADKA